MLYPPRPARPILPEGGCWLVRRWIAKTIEKGNVMSKCTAFIEQACQDVGNDPLHLIDVLHAVQKECRCVNDDAIDLIADQLQIPRVQVDGAFTFPRSFPRSQKAKLSFASVTISSINCGASRKSARYSSRSSRIDFGQTTDDGVHARMDTLHGDVRSDSIRFGERSRRDPL